MGRYKPVNGTEFADNLIPLKEKDSVVYGFAGDDIIRYPGYGTTWIQKKKYQIYGGDGNDRIESRYEGQIISGEEGNDEISALVLNKNKINGGNGNDTLRIDTVTGKKGKSWTIDGGLGDDIIYYGSSPGSYNRKSAIYGGDGNDRLYLSLQNNYNDSTRFFGQAGDDDFVLSSAPPSSKSTYIDGGEGFDKINVGSVADYIIGIDRTSDTEVTIVFSAYQIKGKGYAQNLLLNSFESILVNNQDILLASPVN